MSTKKFKKRKGIFITFEGSEGCGKSTQSKLLYEYLKSKGCKVVYLREPGGTRISERIREILLDPENHMEPETEMLLYMASRAQVVKEIIKPAILKGKIVVCDRFLDSTIAYQGYGLGINISDIKCIGDFATFSIRPDITLLLDLPVHQGLKYRKFLKDRIERRSYLYHLRVRKGYLKLAAEEPKRIKIVKVAEDKNITQQKIRDLIEKYVI